MKLLLKVNVLWIAMLMLALVASPRIASCSSSKSGPKGGKIDACALLAGANPAALLGGPVTKGQARILRHDAVAMVSMCSYSAKDNWKKTMSLYVMYVRSDDNPKTAAEYLKGQDFATVGMKPREIRGLGDVALLVSMPGSLLLQVFWKKHYRMKVSFTEPGDPLQALEKAKSVARYVMDKL